ncbi:Autolysin, partial [Tetrabaena socialis]
SSPSRRRLLSEHEMRARRMVLEYHGTRRSLADFVALKDILSGLSNLNLEATSTQGVVKKEYNGAKDLMIVGGRPLNVSSLTFIFSSSSCGRTLTQLPMSVFNQRWLGTGAPSTAASMQLYHSVCSYNKLRFPTELNRVYGPIDLPCKGTSSKGAYALDTGCDDPELFALWDNAKKYLQKNDPAVFASLAMYRRKVMVFPFATCNWGGLANVGCPGSDDCTTWISPDLKDTSVDLSLVLHELAHNIGLAHSARVVCDSATCQFDDYGDFTDFMGSGGPNDKDGLLCLSAPQAYKAGWSSPVAGGEFKLTDLAVGSTFDNNKFVLPAAALSDKNFLRIIVDQGGMAVSTIRTLERALYVSFRVRQPRTPTPGYDSGLADDYNRRVFVHEFNETADNKASDQRKPPLIQGMLDVKDSTGKSPTVKGTWGVLSDTFTYGSVAGQNGLRIRQV